MNRVAIIDYGMCNLDSVQRALEECGASATITDEPADLDHADRIVLPGVGAFGDAMARMRARGLDTALKELVLGDGVPFLGICLGMQMIATVGEEGGETPGLGWIDGVVRRLQPNAVDRRIPHIGWNEVEARGSSTLLQGIPPRSDFYFVHSYHLDCDVDADSAGVTPYCGEFTSVVERGAIFGVQFHPEKSQQHGFRVLKNFLAY
ncbi:MAG: imidazole glycerol phosphate synthase subunit HisH [Actinobacteria bacterium]|nr:imidazole glycerol phosphate synthase subunit HisH [Actinomycetota bacterium]